MISVLTAALVEMKNPLLEANLRLALTNRLPVLSVSDGIGALLGFTPDDFLSAKVLLQDRIHPDDCDVAARLFSPQAEGQAAAVNLRIRHADGRIRCIRAEYSKQPAAGSGQMNLDLRLQDAKSLRAQLGEQPILANFRAMMENTEDYVYFKDRNHVFTGASQTLASLTDPVEHWTDLLGQTDYDVFPEELANIYYRLEKQVFAGTPVAHEIQETLTKDGRKGWVDNRKYPIFDGEGRIVGLWGIARDITDHMRAEEALRASETSYRTLVESASDGIFVADTAFRTIEVNAAACRMFGYTREELLSLKTTDVVAGPEVARVAPETALLHVGQVHRSDWRCRRKDGSIFPVEATSTLLPDGRRLSILRDVSERRRIEGALRASEASLAAAQARAHLGSWELDLVTMTGHWSAETSRLYHRDPLPDTLTFAECLERIHPEDREKCKQALRDMQESAAPFEFEYRTNPTFGPVRQLSTTAYMIRNSAGNPLRIEGTTLDVTERKLSEAALRESEESLRESQKIAGLGSYVLDVPTGKWTSSDVLNQVFGIDPSFEHDVTGWTALMHPRDSAMMAAYFADEVIGQGKPFDKEYRIVRQNDGVERWVHGLGRLEFDAQGLPLKMRGTIQDITQRKLAEEALRESKELLQLFIEHAPAALAMFDREMRYLAVSRRWIECYFLLGKEVLGHIHYDLFPDIPERWREAHRRGMAGETLRADEDRFERADGSVHWIKWEIRPWRTASGDVGGIVLFSEDVTTHKQAEERLQLAASVFTHAREGIFIADADGSILEVNDTFTRITGYTRDEVLGRNPRLLSSGFHGKEFYAEMWRTIKERGQWSGEVWNRHKNGEIFAEMLTITALFDEHGDARQYVALFSDITVLKEHERKLEHIAHYDILTGLPNRVLLADRLHQAMAHAHRRDQPLAVAFLDLDGFKAVNDRHGHSTGDQLLTALANRMKLALREGDTLARLGGDEFVAVLLDVGAVDTSVQVLNRLLEAAAKPTHVGDLIVQVSASVGVTFYPQPEDVDADQLLRQADQAMYQAKLSGRNRYHIFDSSQDRSVRGHHEDIAHIRKALAAREFVLYYQPMVNMRTGAIMGAEALIRWQHPERGLLPPAMFLPAIEDHPLAVELGEWVIDSALIQLEQWGASGLEIPISVNVGALQLQRADFVDRLRALLAAHPTVKPPSLELEVLETSALQDVAQISCVIAACNEMGVSFALDDFGTGYSSLTYLKRLPAKLLKIDQSFVRGILDDADDLTIIEGVLGLASAFSRLAIAEGVETIEHGLILLQLGCELAQGYGIAHPMPARDLPGWAARWRPDIRWSTAATVGPEDRPLLYAGIEHQAWVAAAEAFLKGERRVPPPLDVHTCRFGLWLDQGRLSGRDSSSSQQAVNLLHQKLHALAEELFSSCAQGQAPEGLDRLDELHSLRDQLLEHLNHLRQTP
jgi:diguanylate cyclase (GGDEF)-like protein/PAS domain S-box-containing protein